MKLTVGNAYLVTHEGPTVLSFTLHAIAVLLKKAKDWIGTGLSWPG